MRLLILVHVDFLLGEVLSLVSLFSRYLCLAVLRLGLVS